MRRAERGGIIMRLLSLVMFLVFLALIYVVRHPLMRLAGQLWVLDEPAERADVIVVLSDDNYSADRAAHAVNLYRTGIAPQIVASGRLGFVAGRGWKRVLLVTSNYHARRTRFIFGRVFRPGVTVRVSAAPDSEFDPSHWWESRLGTKLFFNELVGYAVAWWELRGKTPAAEGAVLWFPMATNSRP